MKYLAEVPDDEINKITHLNAMRHFRFDPFSVRPRERCTVAALRDEASDVDTSVVSRRRHPVEPRTGIVDLATVARTSSTSANPAPAPEPAADPRAMPIHYQPGDDHVVRITIDRPEARNSLDMEHFAQLRKAWDRFGDEDDAWVAVITGVGPDFCVGADLKTYIPQITGLQARR